MHEIQEFRDAIEIGEISLEYNVPLDYSPNLKVGATEQEFTNTVTIAKSKFYLFFDTTHRMEGNSKRFNVWIYKYIRASTKCERKRTFWGGWRGFNVDRINVRDDGNVAFWASELFPPQWVEDDYNVTRTNDDEVKHTVDWSIDSFSLQLRATQGGSIHTATWNGETLTGTSTF